MTCCPPRPLNVRFARVAASVGVGPAGPAGADGVSPDLLNVVAINYANEINNTGATPAINFTTGDLQKLTLNTNATPTFVAPVNKGYVQVRAIQDATPRTITWPGSVLGTPPQPSTVAGSSTFYVFFYDGTNYHYSSGGSASVADGTLVLSSGALKRAPITGDVGIPDGSNTATIPNDTITYPKMQNVSAASRALGRGSAGGAGDVQELDFGGGISVVGTTITIADGAIPRAKLAPETEYDNGSSGTADTISAANGTYQKSTLTGNCTYTLTPPASGVFEIELRMIQGGTGSYTATWPASVIWPASGPPRLSTAVGDEDFIVLSWKGSNWYGNPAPEVPDGHVARWDDGSALPSTLPIGGGYVTVDPTLGLSWKGKNGVETTIAPHGDATSLTRKFADLIVTDAIVTAATTEVSVVEVDLSSASFNGAALTNGLIKVRFECAGVQTAGNFYSHGVEKVALIRRTGGTVTLVDTPANGNSGTGGQLNPSSNAPTVFTIKVSGNIVQGRVAPFDASSATWFGKLMIMGFDL